MRAGAAISLVAFGFLAIVAASEPSKARVHGYALSGTVERLDDAAKTFDVRSSPTRRTRLSWTTATVVLGGTLAVGQRVTLRYLDKDRRHIATSIKIVASPTPAPGAAPAGTSPVPTTPTVR